MSTAPVITWTPDPDHVSVAHRFIDWLAEHRGVTVNGYREIHAWSIGDLGGFWDAVREFFGVIGEGFDGPALAEATMPGALWYPAARLNFAENVLRWAQDPQRARQAAVVHITEENETQEISWASLRDRTAAMAATLPAHRPRGAHRGRRPRPGGHHGHGPHRGGHHPGLHPGAVRAPAVGPVLLRHHRQPQGHPARTRRDAAGVAQGHRTEPGHAPRGPLLRGREHLLDGVEPAGVQPGLRGVGGHLLRLPEGRGHGPAVRDPRPHRRHHVRHRGGLPVPGGEVRPGPGRALGPVRVAGHPLHRVPAAGLHLAVGAPRGQARRPPGLGLRRHGHLLRFRRLQSAGAGAPGGAAGPPAGRRRAGLGRGRPAGDRPGRRDGHPPSDALHAPGTVE